MMLFGKLYLLGHAELVFGKNFLEKTAGQTVTDNNITATSLLQTKAQGAADSQLQNIEYSDANLSLIGNSTCPACLNDFENGMVVVQMNQNTIGCRHAICQDCCRSMLNIDNDGSSSWKGDCPSGCGQMWDTTAERAEVFVI